MKPLTLPMWLALYEIANDRWIHSGQGTLDALARRGLIERDGGRDRLSIRGKNLISRASRVVWP